MAFEALDGERITATIGRRIKALRKQRGFTLEKVAAETKFSVPLLSQIEKGSVNISIAKLWKLSQALGVDISYFFPQDNLSEDFKLTRADARRKVIPDHAVPEFPGYSHEYIASINSAKAVEIFAVDVAALSPEQMVFNTHSTEELAFVLEGDIEFRAEKDNYRVILHPGDLLQFSAQYPHAYRGVGGPAKMLAILYTPPA
jgi:transcriptional regulator with XRE-family HTH domain